MKKAKAPACITVASAAGSSRAVMKMTRVAGDLAHRCANSSIPVIFSIQISRTTSGTEFATTYSRKLSGSLKALTLNPSDLSNRPTDLSTDGSSSTRQTTSAGAILERSWINTDGGRVASSSLLIPYSSGLRVAISSDAVLRPGGGGAQSVWAISGATLNLGLLLALKLRSKFDMPPLRPSPTQKKVRPWSHAPPSNQCLRFAPGTSDVNGSARQFQAARCSKTG